MTVMSYIAHANSIGNEQLFKDLNSIEGCEAEMSQNNEVIVLVTYFENKIDEERIKNQLDIIPSLAQLALVYAGNEDDLINQKF